MAEHAVRYMVGHDWAERVSDTTALPHRLLTIDERGDVSVMAARPSNPGAGGQIIHIVSAAELTFLAREARRAARARFWARLLGRR